MRKLIVLRITIILILLPIVIIVGCQQQPEPSPPLPEPTPHPPHSEGEYVPDQIIVKFKSGTPGEAEEQLNQSLGTTVIHTSPSAGFKALQIPEGKTVAEMVTLYSEQPIVEYAEPNYIDYIQPDAKEGIER